MINPPRSRVSLFTIVALVLSIAGLITDWYMFAPGFMSPDSVDQLTQAAENHYSDWHPPVMAGLWHLLNYLWFGPAPMLLFQLALLWTACFMLMTAFKKRYAWAALLIPFWLCSMYIQNFAGNIWKDMHLAFSWLLAAAIMLSAAIVPRKLNRPEAVVALLLLTYGCWTRPNGFPGVLPLCVLWTELLIGSSRRPPRAARLIVTAVLITVGMIVAQAAFSKWIMRAENQHAEYKLFAHDLTGIYATTGDFRFPPFITSYPGFDSAYLRRNYLVSTFDNVWWNPEKKKIFPLISNRESRQLMMCWMKAIAAHPKVYLRNRVRGFLYFLRIKNSGSSLTIQYPYIHPNRYGLTYTTNPLCEKLMNRIDLNRQALYFQPWFWVALNVLLLPLVLLQPFRTLRAYLLSLLASPLFIVLVQIPVVPVDTEFRYFYWNCIAVSLAGLVMLFELSLRVVVFVRSRSSFSRPA